MPENILVNPSFEEGWRDLPPLPGNLINQEPFGWNLAQVQIGDKMFGSDDPAGGLAECVHKLSTQLPADEQLGGPNALILHGSTVYKVFHAQAPFGTELVQIVSGLTPGSIATLTVPIQLHKKKNSDGSEDTDPFTAESGVWLNGIGDWANAQKMGDHVWYKHTVSAPVSSDGVAKIIIWLKSKWRGADFFLDNLSLTVEEPVIQEPPPEEEEPPQVTKQFLAKIYESNPTYPEATDVRLAVLGKPNANGIRPRLFFIDVKLPEGTDSIRLNVYKEEVVEDDSPGQPIPPDEDSEYPVWGIDVSTHQGLNVDWQAVANLKYRFVYIRAGSGRTPRDSNYDHQWAESGRNGLLRGAYWYLYPGNAAKQAADFLALIKDDIQLPPVVDIEEAGLTLLDVKSFVETFRSLTGISPSVYTNVGSWNPIIPKESTWTNGCGLWVANWTSASQYIEPWDGFLPAIPHSWTQYDFWQWSSHGSYTGYTGRLDINWFRGTYGELKAFSEAFKQKWANRAPITKTYDLLNYLKGDGRQYELRYTWNGGGTHSVQGQSSDDTFYIVKGGGEYEELYYDDQYIYRGIDTSEAPDKFYVQQTAGKHGAVWCKRHTQIGESITKQPTVVHYWKSNCTERARGNPVDVLTLKAHYPKFAFDSGITLDDVVFLEWNKGEGYFFARNYGLVGFTFSGGKSFISEIHQGRPNLLRITPPCYQFPGRYYVSNNPLIGLKLGPILGEPHVITSRFNAPRDYANGLHEGIDFDVLTTGDSKANVLCVYDGVVDRSLDSTGGYGKYVRVKHTRNGSVFYTRFAHLDARYVQVGQSVRKGDPLGEIGKSGKVTGEHIHLNLEVPGFGLSGYAAADVVDPIPYLTLG